MLCPPANYTVTGAITQTTAPELIRMKYAETMLESCYTLSAMYANPMEVLGAAPVSEVLMTGDLRMGQSLTIFFKDQIDPTTLVNIKSTTYDRTNICTPHMVRNCTAKVCAPQDTYKSCVVEFDSEYSVGTSWCATDGDFRYESYEEKYLDTVKAAKFMVAVNAWNKLICELLANPATTVGPEATCFPVHYIQAGAAGLTAVNVLTDVVSYMKGLIMATDLTIIAPRQFETDLLASGSTLHVYNSTGQQSPAIHTDMLTHGGFRPIVSLPSGLWGERVLIADDNRWFYKADGTNINPFMSNDGTKYYVLIAAKNSFYSGVRPVTSSPVKLYPSVNGCDANLTEGQTQSWLTFNKVLRNCDFFLIEFDKAC